MGDFHLFKLHFIDFLKKSWSHFTIGGKKGLLFLKRKMEGKLIFKILSSQCFGKKECVKYSNLCFPSRPYSLFFWSQSINSLYFFCPWIKGPTFKLLLSSYKSMIGNDRHYQFTIEFEEVRWVKQPCNLFTKSQNTLTN